MNKLSNTVIAICIGLACNGGAVAQALSPEQYRTGNERIAADYKSADAACGSSSGNARDICKAQAGGNEKVAKAQLDAKYQPTQDASFKLRVTQAQAEYAVAREKCDDKAGNVKDVCLKEAKADELTAKANAKAQMKTVTANEQAARASAAANDKAVEQGAAARKDAASAKRDADYTVAKEKCDAFAGDAKDRCTNDAKARFGRS